MLVPILIAVAALIVVLVIVISLRPATFRVQRSVSITAPPAAIFEQVNDIHHFHAWNPWAKLDPNMKLSYAGPAAGVGAVHSWEGNNQVGAGRMTIQESHPLELVRMKLEFFRPFKSIATAEFPFKTTGDQTVVSWIMTGDCNFMSKAFGLFMNQDKMLGGAFEEGLAKLKAIAESAVKK
jgi:Polyketide cyclase / dehydrase and lipid transport